MQFLSSPEYFSSGATALDRLLAFIGSLSPVLVERKLIRLGAPADGGYLVPDDLDGIVACFSPGVEFNATFEQALIDKGIPCFLADASVTDPPFLHPMIDFTRTFLGISNDECTVTLDDWVKKKAPPAGDLLLQMDIEGAEWPVLLNVSDEILRRFRIIVVELHGLNHLADRFGFGLISVALSRLLKYFMVVHLHPNNYSTSVTFGYCEIPVVLEMTLLRRDRSLPTGFAHRFPHPLDRPNHPHARDLVLAPPWYRMLNDAPPKIHTPGATVS